MPGPCSTAGRAEGPLPRHLDLGHVGRQHQVVGRAHVGERHDELRALRRLRSQRRQGRQSRRLLVGGTPCQQQQAGAAAAAQEPPKQPRRCYLLVLGRRRHQLVLAEAGVHKRVDKRGRQVGARRVDRGAYAERADSGRRGENSVRAQGEHGCWRLRQARGWDRRRRHGACPHRHSGRCSARRTRGLPPLDEVHLVDICWKEERGREGRRDRREACEGGGRHCRHSRSALVEHHVGVAKQRSNAHPLASWPPSRPGPAPGSGTAPRGACCCREGTQGVGQGVGEDTLAAPRPGVDRSAG